MKLPPEKCEAFWQRLDLEQAELPEIMTAQTAAELVGHNPQRIHERIREEILTGIKLGSIRDFAKTKLVFWVLSFRNAHVKIFIIE